MLQDVNQFHIMRHANSKTTYRDLQEIISPASAAPKPSCRDDFEEQKELEETSRKARNSCRSETHAIEGGIFQTLSRMAGTTGLEPAASAVTGQRSNQLNYVPTRQSTNYIIASVYAALHELHKMPRLLNPTQIV
jgi:hypothetical protein